MTSTRCLCLLAVFVVGCDPPRDSGSRAPAIPARSNPIGESWDRAAVARVEGHRFRLPEDSQGFSLLEENRVALQKLEALSIKSAELNREQSARLIEFVYGSQEPTPAAACYDPHHLFLFYDEEGETINAVEICFSCLNIRTSPDLPEDQWWRHDFRGLARLCDEVGIGMVNGSAEEFVKFLDTRNAARD